MKRMVSMVLVALMLLSFVGCKEKASTAQSGSETNAGTEAAASTDTEATTSTTTDASQTEEKQEIYNMVMEIVNYGYDDKDIQMIEEEVNKITEAKIGVHVDFMTVPIGNMATKLELAVVGGEKLDLVHTGLLTNPSRLAAQGLLTPMTEYLTDTLKELAGELLKATTINGEVYAYPGNLYPGANVSLVYDKDLADQYGIVIPESITSKEDFEKIFDQVLASGMTQYPISIGDGVNSEYTLGANYENLGDSAYNSFGVVLGDDPTNTIVNWYASDVYKKQSEIRREWYEKGYSLPDSISNGYTVNDSMSQGTIFSFVTSLGTGSSVAYWSAQSGKNLASVPIRDVKIEASGVSIISYGISSTCDNPQKVCDFLELLYTDVELANLMSYGMEGTHYVTQENSKIIKYPEGLDAMSVGYGSFIGPFGDSSQIYYREPLTDEFVASVEEYGAKKAKVSKYMGYTFDTTKVQSELAAVSAVITQYAPSLACGIIEVETILPEFIEALNTAGMDQIIAENQTQLNAWLAQQ